jgi:hypothetical protein
MLGYDFFKLLNEHLSVNVAITNVLALSAASGISGTEGSPNGTQFGTAAQRQDFRSVTMGARYEF